MFLPMFRESALLIAAAVIPAVILMISIYRSDKHEKEPLPLLGRLLVLGVVSCFPAALLEQFVGNVILPMADIQSEEVCFALIGITTGMIEEGCKFFFLKKYTWNHPAFNYLYDGVVYAVFVSLGFATFENIFYVYEYGLQVAGLRAVLAIPGHTAFAVLMGYFYGQAKLADIWGDERKCFRHLLLAWVSAAAFHGIYDAAAMIGTDTAMIVFWLFIAVMYLTMSGLIRRGSRRDRAMY